MRRLRLTLTMTMMFAGTALAQPAAAPKPAPPLSPESPAGAATASPSEAYTYQQEGRRDPFLTLLGTGSEPRQPSKRGDGAAGMLSTELSVRGVMQNGGALIALVQGPDAKTYIVRAGDKLMDGTVKAVTPEGLTIVQDVNDPLSLVKTREVRKVLKSVEGSKP